MKIAIGCDEAAYELKVVLEEYLDKKKIEWKDFGAQKGEKSYIQMLQREFAWQFFRKNVNAKFSVCGTGIGMAISAR